MVGLLVIALGGVASAAPGPLSTGRVGRFAGFGPDSGFSGDGYLAPYAQLAAPWGLAADAHGSVYIADTGNERIRRVDPKGKITTIAGTGRPGESGDGGPATHARLELPGGLAVGPQGNVYVIGLHQSSENIRVRMIDTDGTMRPFAGSATAGFSGDGGPAVDAQIDHPNAIAADSQGDVYIGEPYRIRKVDPSGIISTIAGIGTPGFSGDGGPARAAQFNVISALAADRQGNLYVGDDARVRRIDHATGTITTVAGNGTTGFSGDGGPATSARLSTRTAALAVDAHGTLYIADTNNIRIRAVDTGGRITTIIGTGSESTFPGWGGPGRAFGLSEPAGLAVDSHGRLLISDTNQNAVWQFTRGLTAKALGDCTRAAARQVIEHQHLGDSLDNPDPVAQVFCGGFTGRHSHAMVVSLGLPSCGGSYGWLVYRSVHHQWKRALNHNGGAVLTRSGRTILEWQGVLGPHDAHCLPSSARVRAWHWNGRRLVHGSWHRRPKLPKHPPSLRP